MRERDLEEAAEETKLNLEKVLQCPVSQHQEVGCPVPVPVKVERLRWMSQSYFYYRYSLAVLEMNPSTLTKCGFEMPREGIKFPVCFVLRCPRMALLLVQMEIG